MWDDIAAVIKNRVESTLEQTEHFLSEHFKKLYLRILVSLSSVAIVCSSVVAFIHKLAERLDSNETEIWTRSMSLYVVVIIIGLYILKNSIGANREKRIRTMPEAPIKRISQRKKPAKRQKPKKK